MSDIPWFKVDDRIHGHKKTKRAGVEAMGLWVLCGAWSSDNSEDGFVPDYIADGFSKKARQYAERLVRAGYFEESEKDGDQGWVLHDFHDYNPTAEKVKATREQWAERQRRSRSQRKVSTESHDGVTRDDEQSPAPVTESRPVPSRTPKETPSSKVASDLDADPRSEVIELCEHLAARVRTNGHKVPEKLGKAWWRPCRLLLDVDGREVDKVRRAIDWATADPFWSSNIRSMATLREKYTIMQAQAKTKRGALAPVEGPRYVPPYEGDPDDLEAYNAHYAQHRVAS